MSLAWLRRSPAIVGSLWKELFELVEMCVSEERATGGPISCRSIGAGDRDC
jgi:hypothetical protein